MGVDPRWPVESVGKRLYVMGTGSRRHGGESHSPAGSGPPSSRRSDRAGIPRTSSQHGEPPRCEDPLVAIRPLREQRADVDPFSPEEIAAFLAACPAAWRPYFTVAFWTGVRPGELAALKWGDVD